MKKSIKKIIKKIFNKSKIKNFIIMESRPDFSDNTKRIFDYLIENNYNQKYKIIWLLHDNKKFKKIKINNVKFISDKSKFIKFYYLIHAKYLINCNREIFKINNKTISINLWHGTILKHLENLGLIEHENINYCLCPSKFYLDIYEKELHVPKEKLVIFNNPRNDYLFSNKCNLSDFFGKKYSKYIIWMPTFRKAVGKRIDSDYNFSMGIPIIQSINDAKKLNSILEELDILMVIKPHFAQDMSVFKVNELSNIKVIYSEDLIEKNIELYEFLGKFDALITDYSSVYFDFLITNKSIGFTIDDMKNYAENKGFIFDDVKKYMPGMKISNMNQMKKFIEDLKNSIDEYDSERKEICDLVNTYKDDKNAERIVKFLGI